MNDIMKSLQGAIELCCSDFIVNEQVAEKILEKIKKEADLNNSYVLLSIKIICELVIEKSISVNSATQKIKTLVNNYFPPKIMR
jgi:hypothetical protein